MKKIFNIWNQYLKSNLIIDTFRLEQQLEPKKEPTIEEIMENIENLIKTNNEIYENIKKNKK